MDTFPRNPIDLNRHGQALKQVGFTIVGLTGGAGGTVVAQSGSCSQFVAPSWIVGVQLSATFCVNTTNPKFVSIGLQGANAALQNVATCSNMLLTLAHALGTTTTTNVPISKGGAMFFQWPFLPFVDSGQRVFGFASNDLAAGERILAVCNIFYVIGPIRSLGSPG